MATATIQVQYEADTTTLKSVINEINLINDVVVKGATDSAKKVKASYTEISKGFSAAFGSQEVSKALGNQTTAIENLGKKGLSLSSSLKGLKQQISELDSAGQAGTDTFNKLVLAAAKLEDQIGDTRARVKILASDTFKFDAAVQAVGALSSVFATAQGAAALFGEKSKDLEKALLKVQAATAIANGVAQIANLIKEESALKTAVLTGAQEAYNIAVGKSTGLLKAFRIGLAGTGIGLFVFAIVELISYFQELQAQSANTQTVFERFKDTFANAKIAIEGYRDSIINAQERIDVALGKTTKLQADVNRQRREDTAKLGKELAPLIVAQEKLRAEYEKELAIVNSPAFKVSSDDRIQALLKSEKIGKELAIVEAEVSRVRTEGRAAINASTKAIVEEEKATRKAKEEKESNNKKVKQTSLEYLKLSETLDEYSKKQRDAIKIDTELSDLNLKTAEESFQTRIFFLQAEQAAGDKSLETKIQIIKAEGEARKAALDLNVDFANRSKIIDAETQAAITAATKTETDKRIDLAVQYASAVVDAFAAINELSKVNSENRITEITATSEAELNAINASTDLERDKQRQRVALEKRTNQAIANEKTKQARSDKALALFNIAINTASSIIKTGEQLGYPAAIPFQILAGIIGGVQLAAVAAKPLPKFEKGGLIGGKLHSQGGTLIEAEQGEYMVNRRQSAKHRRELDAMNTSTEAFRRMIDEKYVRPALMGYSAGRRGKEGVIVNASLNSKSMEKELKTINKTLKQRNMVVNINQQDSRYSWQ